MSRKFSKGYAEDVVGEVPTVGKYHAVGTTVPTDGSAGYANGCIFQDLDASSGATLFVNEGTVTSCDFNQVLTSGSSGNIPTLNSVTVTVSAASSTPVALSNGDGSTAMTAKAQILGANKGASSLALGSFSTTSTTVAAPSVDFLKSAHATVGSNTVVVSGEVLGEINWFGADGTDFNSAAARIACVVDTTPGTGDMPGRLVFSTTTDGSETLSEALRIDNAQRVISGGVSAQTVGSVIGSEQTWGTTQAKSQFVLGCASTTDATQAEFAFVKGGNAAVGSFTTVAASESLGCITWYGDNGTDYNNPYCRIAAVVDATPGAADAPGRLVFSTTTDGANTLSEAARIDNAQRLVVGAVAAQTVSSGDGSTSSIPRVQLWGTSVATGTLLVGCANTTDSISGGIAIVKGGNASVGSFTTVASGESLGTITWFGDNGTDYLSPAAKIECLVDSTPGAADMPGRIAFFTTTDGTETMTEAMRIDNAQVVRPLKGLVVTSSGAAAITTTRSLSAADSNCVFSVAKTGAYAITLPAAAAGLKFKFMVLDAGANAVTISSGSAHLYGDVSVANVNTSLNGITTITLVATGDIGDWVSVEGIDSTHYLVTGACKTGAKMTFA